MPKLYWHRGTSLPAALGVDVASRRCRDASEWAVGGSVGDRFLIIQLRARGSDFSLCGPPGSGLFATRCAQYDFANVDLADWCVVAYEIGPYHLPPPLPHIAPRRRDEDAA